MSSASKFFRALAILGVFVVGLAVITFITLAPAKRHVGSTQPAQTAVGGTSKNTVKGGSGTPMAQATYVGFDDLKAVTDEASVIVKGKALAEHTARLNFSEGADRDTNPTLIDCVVVDFKVMRVIKGNIHKNDVIPVAYIAGENVPGLEKNASSIVFLSQMQDGPYMPLNPAQGVVRIENGKAKADNSGSLIDDGTSEENVIEQAAE